MQGQERAQRYLWKADLEASAKDRVELPRRHDRNDARHQLDVDELARCTPLALNATRTPPKERMPAIVDHDILPDMGRMTARLPSIAKTLSSPAATKGEPTGERSKHVGVGQRTVD